ncbi:uncharacterized protein LOC125033590 isoform X2 [Penaeus chinensis]|uniref:uncharacterized protein LOC125033590 isoform X2 n=1 Tax=Penaeus chinensis TaxID=139456 RepID=UPI001FB6C66C|nr:uncharacterized protein LOC125033590 isoform X2 [Penaeus chinensis]
MQAALLVRNKRTKKRKDSKTLSLASLPPHVATKPINPFPRYNPVQLPNGKNAWGGKVGDKKKAAENHRRWINRNKVEDDPDSNDDDDEELDVGDTAGGNLEKNADGRYRQTGVVNIVLYVGLGLIALGLIITFVGLGEHGFKSPELRLIGPSLIGCGFLFALLRLFFCSAPDCCTSCRKAKPLDEKSLLSPSRETLAEDSVADTPQPQQNQQPQKVQTQQPQSRRRHDEAAAAAEDDDNDDGVRQSARRMPTKSALQSSIPNYIEDECEDDEILGLSVEYMDETSSVKKAASDSLSGTRPTSATSRLSTASKVPRLPEIHAGRRNSELVLNPATLEPTGE